MNVFNINRQYDSFLEQYDSGNLKFNTLQYRAGAPITGHFGLTKGYRLEDGEWYWDSVRIHSGVDRGAGKVIAPFNFNRSEYYDWGEDNDYGSIVRLFQDEYGFEMRIAHMHPKLNLVPEVLYKLKNEEPIERNTYLGTAGNYGKSNGKHTHTEIVSINDRCNIFNKLLHNKFGQDVFNNYDDDFVLSFYSDQGYWKDKPIDEIFEHYESLKNRYRVYGLLNQYQYQFKDWFYDMQIRTRYSSELLFNGL